MGNKFFILLLKNKFGGGGIIAAMYVTMSSADLFSIHYTRILRGGHTEDLSKLSKLEGGHLRGDGRLPRTTQLPLFPGPTQLHLQVKEIWLGA